MNTGQITHTAKLVQNGDKVAIEIVVEIGTRDERVQRLLQSKMLRIVSMVEPDLMSKPIEDIEWELEMMEKNQARREVTQTPT